MIRFIDLRGQIMDGDDPHFAFFDTVTDKFLDLTGEQEWDSTESFVEACYCGHKTQSFMERCVRLIPADYFHK